MEEKKLKSAIVSDISLEVISKSIFKETVEIGFTKADYIKLVNKLLDITMDIDTGSHSNNGKESIEYYRSEKIDFPLKSKNLLIRKINKRTDAKVIQEWLEDPNGKYFLLTSITQKQNKTSELLDNEDNLLGFVTLHDDTPVGLMGFLDVDNLNRKAELRKLIGESHRGKGFGKEATKLWLKFGISNLGLRKIYLNTVDTNIRNIRINKDLGFEVEGILRKEYLIDDKYQDILRMSLIRD